MTQDKLKQCLKALLVAVLFVLSLWLVIIGQKNIGPSGLGLMMAGLAGLLLLLYLYNRPYSR